MKRTDVKSALILEIAGSEDAFDILGKGICRNHKDRVEFESFGMWNHP